MRSNAWPERALAVLAACSLEAAWLFLAYVTFEGITGHVAPLSLLAFALAVLIGLVFARWSARHPRVPYRVTMVLMVVAAAIVGWLLPLGQAGAGLVDAPVATFDAHPGGFLLGVAVLRGSAHITPDDDERIAKVALGPGLALVAGMWVLLAATGAIHEPAIVEVAYAATVTFVTAGLLGIGLARLADPATGTTPRAGRRTWTGLLVGVVAALLAVAIPLALVVGVPAESAVRGVLGPLADVALAIAVAFALPIGVLAAVLVQVFTFLRDTFNLGSPAAVVGQVAENMRRLIGSSPGEPPSLGIVPAIVALVVMLVLLRGLVRRSGVAVVGRNMIETREVERPVLNVGFHRPRLRAPRRRTAPHTASEAYLASLEDLARSPGSGRLEWETPSEHARRLRDDPVGPALGRLAADYMLAEFGGRTLPATEHRRAIERWRRIREALGR